MREREAREREVDFIIIILIDIDIIIVDIDIDNAIIIIIIIIIVIIINIIVNIIMATRMKRCKRTISNDSSFWIQLNQGWHGAVVQCVVRVGFKNLSRAA